MSCWSFEILKRASPQNLSNLLEDRVRIGLLKHLDEAASSYHPTIGGSHNLLEVLDQCGVKMTVINYSKYQSAAA